MISQIRAASAKDAARPAFFLFLLEVCRGGQAAGQCEVNSLCLLSREGATALHLSAGDPAALADGATLAISIEPPWGALPTGFAGITGVIRAVQPVRAASPAPATT